MGEHSQLPKPAPKHPANLPAGQSQLAHGQANDPLYAKAAVRRHGTPGAEDTGDTTVTRLETVAVSGCWTFRNTVPTSSIAHPVEVSEGPAPSRVSGLAAG